MGRSSRSTSFADEALAAVRRDMLQIPERNPTQREVLLAETTTDQHRKSSGNQLFARKSIDKLIAESEEPEHQLKKSLGPWSLTALGIGAIIGSGIFVLTGTAAAGEFFQ